MSRHVRHSGLPLTLLVTALVALAGCATEAPEESVGEPEDASPNDSTDPGAGAPTSEPAGPEPGNGTAVTADPADEHTANATPPAPDPEPEGPEDVVEQVDGPTGGDGTASSESGSNGPGDASTHDPTTSEEETPSGGEERAPSDGPAPDQHESRTGEPSNGNETNARGNETGWPHDGSTVVYDVRFGHGSPGGVPWHSYNLTVTFTFSDDAWTARCTGTATHREYNSTSGEVETRNETVNESAALAPPTGPANVTVGDNVTVPGVRNCEYVQHDVQVHGQQPYNATVNGERATTTVWYADRYPECNCQGEEAYWDTDTDLVLEWWWGGRAGGWSGKLVDTDAPLG